MLKIEVTEKNDNTNVSVVASGGLGTIIGEFCSAVESFKDKLREIDEGDDSNIEFMFVAPMVATLLDMDKHEAMSIALDVLKKEAGSKIKEQKKESEEGEKDAPVDKQD